MALAIILPLLLVQAVGVVLVVLVLMAVLLLVALEALDCLPLLLEYLRIKLAVVVAGHRRVQEPVALVAEEQAQQVYRVRQELLIPVAVVEVVLLTKMVLQAALVS